MIFRSMTEISWFEKRFMHSHAFTNWLCIVMLQQKLQLPTAWIYQKQIINELFLYNIPQHYVKERVNLPQSWLYKDGSMYTAFPTAASASIQAAADDRRSSYDPTANSIRNAFMRIRASTLLYHSLVRTYNVKDKFSFKNSKHRAI